MRSALTPIFAVLLGACSATDVLNAASRGADIEIVREIPYADGERRTLDIYAPRGARNAPLALFYYGGGWESGNKESYEFVAAALASEGIVTVVPDYRVYPAARFPDFLTDAALAARWTKDNAARYGADPDRLVLTGHSAGAYIAVMLALDSHWLDRVGLIPKRDVAGAIGLAGPYDFLPLTSNRLKEIFGPEQQWPRTQPINYANSVAPALLLITGGFDFAVDPGNSKRLAARIQAAGGEARAVTYRGTGHMLLLGAMAKPLRLFAPTLDDMVSFIKTRPESRSRLIAGAAAE